MDKILTFGKFAIYVVDIGGHGISLLTTHNFRMFIVLEFKSHIVVSPVVSPISFSCVSLVNSDILCNIDKFSRACGFIQRNESPLTGQVNYLKNSKLELTCNLHFYF